MQPEGRISAGRALDASARPRDPDRQGSGTHTIQFCFRGADDGKLTETASSPTKWNVIVVSASTACPLESGGR
jgi:hypothetical protein